MTVEDLRVHGSGICGCHDETADDKVDDYVLPAPVHTLVSSTEYLAVLDGHPQSFAAGERFAYNFGGFVALALLGGAVLDPAAWRPLSEVPRENSRYGLGFWLQVSFLAGDTTTST